MIVALIKAVLLTQKLNKRNHDFHCTEYRMGNTAKFVLFSPHKFTFTANYGTVVTDPYLLQSQHVQLCYTIKIFLNDLQCLKVLHPLPSRPCNFYYI